MTFSLAPIRLYFIIFLIPLFSSCSESDENVVNPSKRRTESITKISRHQGVLNHPLPPLKKGTQPRYQWEENRIGNIPKITKEYFRCKGSQQNPVKVADQNDKIVRYYDCGGADKHSLPLREGKEYIYNSLITLLNHLQAETKKRVVITSGHRCPDHNTYVDHSSTSRFSKHMIGAEVSFYVQGLEYYPQKIVDLIKQYYENHTDKEYSNFQRYEKSDTDVNIQPWYNKEVYIKLYQKYEGRNFDNRHPYPYISIQVRYDQEKKERVLYSWDKAHNNFLRN